MQFGNQCIQRFGNYFAFQPDLALLYRENCLCDIISNRSGAQASLNSPAQNGSDEMRVAAICKDQDINSGVCVNLPEQVNQTELGEGPGQQQNVGPLRLDHTEKRDSSSAHPEQFNGPVLSREDAGKIARQNPAHHDADRIRPRLCENAIVIYTGATRFCRALS